MSAYDRWLEAPYQQHYAEAEAFQEFADNAGYDLDNPDELAEAEEAWEDRKEAMNEPDPDAWHDARADDDYAMERGWY